MVPTITILAAIVAGNVPAEINRARVTQARVQMRNLGRHSPACDLISLGADGIEGGEGAAADLENWRLISD